MALVPVACLVIAFRVFGVLEASARAIETGRVAIKTIRDPEMTDIDKERTVQKALLSMMVGFLSIVGRAAGTIAVSLLPLLVFEVTGIARFSVVTHFLATWQGIVWTSVIMTSAYLVRRER